LAGLTAGSHSDSSRITHHLDKLNTDETHVKQLKDDLFKKKPVVQEFSLSVRLICFSLVLVHSCENPVMNKLVKTS
jgi:hypothetical protein